MLKQKSFTLIELLVAVFIVAIMASLITINVISHQKAARDAKRKSDLNTLALALEMYYEKNGTYNVTGSIPDTGQMINSGDPSIASTLINNGYLSSSLRDPQESIGHNDYCLRPSVALPGLNSGFCLFANVELESSQDTEIYQSCKGVSRHCNGPIYNYIIGHK